MNVVHRHHARPDGKSSTRAVYNRHVGISVQEEDPTSQHANDAGYETIEELLEIVSHDTYGESWLDISRSA